MTDTQQNILAALYMAGVIMLAEDQAEKETTPEPYTMPTLGPQQYAYRVIGDTLQLNMGLISFGLSKSLLSTIGTGLNEVKVIQVEGVGGKVAESKKLAAIVESLGLTTSVRHGGECFSSCLAVFTAGKVRRAYNGSILGIHTTSNPSKAYNMGYCQYLLRNTKRPEKDKWLCNVLLSTPEDSMYRLNGVRAYKTTQLVTHLLPNQTPEQTTKWTIVDY